MTSLHRSYLRRSSGMPVFRQMVGQADRRNHKWVIEYYHVVQAEVDALNALDCFQDLCFDALELFMSR